MIFLKICSFHLLCCLLSMGIIALNLTFTAYQGVEIAFYIVYSLFITICYFLFGYKIVITDKISLSFNSQIWLLTIIIIIVSFLDIKMAFFINLPFCTISSLLYEGIVQNERTICVITSLLPAALIQIGSVCGMR